MNRSWKRFTVIIASMLCVIIVCITINVSISAITNNILPQNGGNSDVQGGNSDNVGSNQQQGNNIVGDGSQTTVPGVPGQTGSDNGTTQQNPGVGNPNSSSQQAVNPLGFSKAQIISYYNSALNKSYSQPSMNVTKSERVSVEVTDFNFNGGQTNETIMGLANKIVTNNEKDTTETKSFAGGRASDGTAAPNYVLPTNLTAAGVKSANVSKNGAGYKVTITLVSESCDFTTMPPYNKSCAWPLDFRDIDFGGMAKITKADFYYPGTKLTASIDGNGRVSYVQVNMPLTVSNGTGEILMFPFKGNTVSASVNGEWVCKLSMTF